MVIALNSVVQFMVAEGIGQSYYAHIHNMASVYTLHIPDKI